MNCRDWEERVALYAGGDLEPAGAAAVEKHLAGCSGCQVFASGMRQSVELLRESRGDLPAEAAFTAVRARVLGRIAARRRWGWAAALAGIATAAACVALMLQVERRPVPKPPALIARVPRAPGEAFLIPRRIEPRPVYRAKTVRAKTTSPVLIRMVSNDPDVVIYWIAERKGD
jgi:hypothetical protein